MAVAAKPAGVVGAMESDGENTSVFLQLITSMTISKSAPTAGNVGKNRTLSF